MITKKIKLLIIEDSDIENKDLLEKIKQETSFAELVLYNDKILKNRYGPITLNP